MNEKSSHKADTPGRQKAPLLAALFFDAGNLLRY